MKPVTTHPIDFVKHLPIFGTLSDEELERLGQSLRSRAFKRYDTIYEAGAPSHEVFFLVKGSVKISAQSTDGREVIKHLLHPLAVFGELGLIGEENRRDTAVVMSREALLYSMTIRQFQQFMHRNPSLMTNVLQLIGLRLQQTENRLESMIFHDARQRIIEFLKESARKRGKRVGFETLIKHSLTQQDIANITGTSRQTVTSVLNELRKANLIYFNRRSILIRDLARLE